MIEGWQKPLNNQKKNNNIVCLAKQQMHTSIIINNKITQPRIKKKLYFNINDKFTEK